MSITREALLAAGYKFFTQRNLKEFTDEFCQKCFGDTYGTRYFVTISIYDNRKFQHRIENMEDFSYSPETQFTTLEGVTFDIGMHSPKSVEEMEKFFDSLWLAMSCEHYERYNEETE